MDTERARAFLLALPHVVETVQWGDNLVFWVGDKAIGGKMFCLISLDAGAHGVVSFATGPERFHELLENDGLKPAPYFARIHWIAADRWNALRHTEWEELLRAAQELTFAKMSKRTREAISAPAAERSVDVVPKGAPVTRSPKKATKQTKSIPRKRRH